MKKIVLAIAVVSFAILLSLSFANAALDADITVANEDKLRCNPTHNCDHKPSREWNSNSDSTRPKPAFGMD